MILTCRILALAAGIPGSGSVSAQVGTASPEAAGAPVFDGKMPVEQEFFVTGLAITGAERTDQEWLVGYIDLQLPARMTRSDALSLSRRLLTTSVYSDVRVLYEESRHRPGEFILHIHLEEKWTTIPVIRGVYGGGTPLSVLGVYDIHALGRLLTLGGEFRKYGDAPAGYVIYGRDPRSHGDRYFLGLEYWRDFRRRPIFVDDELAGVAGTDARIVGARVLLPLDTQGGHGSSWKYGFHLTLTRDAVGSWEGEDGSVAGPPPELGLADESRNATRFQLMLQYDRIEINKIEYSGPRLAMRSGPVFTSDKMHVAHELDVYHYWLPGMDFNLAARLFAGVASDTSIQNQYFLGGFDSVRGYPDGVRFGNRAVHGSLELRHLTFRSRYIWLQPVVFADAGTAASAVPAFESQWLSSAGAGLRIAVPRVHRLIFRIDYAWGLDGSGQSGITAGMNQFFDPFTPL